MVILIQLLLSLLIVAIQQDVFNAELYNFKNMKKLFSINQSKKERIIRFIVGILLSAPILFENSTLYLVLLALGGALIFNAFSGLCFIYKMLGFSTCPIKD